MTENENDLLDGSAHRTGQSRLACQLVVSRGHAELVIGIAPEE